MQFNGWIVSPLAAHRETVPLSEVWNTYFGTSDTSDVLLITPSLSPSNLQCQKVPQYNFPQEKQLSWYFWLKFLLPLQFHFLVSYTLSFFTPEWITLWQWKNSILFQKFSNKWKAPKLKNKLHRLSFVVTVKTDMKPSSNWKWTWLSGDEIQLISISLERGKNLGGQSLHTKSIHWSLMIFILKYRQLTHISNALGKEYPLT